MEKKRLDLDSLEVDSFATDAPGDDTARGLVQTQQPAYTCAYTCGSRVIFICCTG